MYVFLFLFAGWSVIALLSKYEKIELLTHFAALFSLVSVCLIFILLFDGQLWGLCLLITNY